MKAGEISSYLGEYYSSTPNLVRVFKILREAMHPSKGGDIEPYADLVAEFAVALYSRHVRAARALHQRVTEAGSWCPLVPPVDAVGLYEAIRASTLARMSVYRERPARVDNAAPLVHDEPIAAKPTGAYIPAGELLYCFAVLNLDR